MCRFPVATAAFVEALLLTGGGSPKLHQQRHLFMSTAENRAKSNDEALLRSDYDPINDWTPPPLDIVRRAQRERIGPMRFLTSPIFFSTDARTGRRQRGLSCLPRQNGETRPLLFVSNHQLVGLDSWMVVSEILEKRDIFTRSLVHPLVFPSSGSLSESKRGPLLSYLLNGGPTTSSARERRSADSFLESFGAVKVSPRNLYRLMETNQPTLLFPGGARESFHGRGETYTLNAWPDEKTDFVRIAAKFNAEIVPFSSIGAAESAFFLADPPEQKKIPFGIGGVIADFMGENAPYDARYDNGEVLTFPLVLPKPIPARHFFLFHKPICTSDIDHTDREACRKAYDIVKTEIRQGVNDLLRASKKDPFKDPTQRVMYERVWNRQAPTFPVEELNS